MRYFLLDANVLVAYYCKADEDGALRRRAADLVAARADGEAFLYVPNFCVAETLRAFAKKCWQEKLFGNTHQDAREAFDSFRKALLDDVVDGKILYSYELSRRHIKLTDRIYELSSRLSFRSGSVPSTFDVLLIAMGCDLMRIHGEDNLFIVTAERPIVDVCFEARKELPQAINLAERDAPI